MVQETSIFETIYVLIFGFFTMFAPAQMPAQNLAIHLSSENEDLRFYDPADVSMVENEQGPRSVHVRLSAQDSQQLSDYTARHIGEYVGFYVCDFKLMEAVVQERISGGTFVISSPNENATIIDFIENGCP